MKKKITDYPGVLYFQAVDIILKIWKKNPNLTKRQIGVWYSWKADTKENNLPLSLKEIKSYEETLKKFKRTRETI